MFTLQIAHCHFRMNSPNPPLVVKSMIKYMQHRCASYMGLEAYNTYFRHPLHNLITGGRKERVAEISYSIPPEYTHDTCQS